MLKEFQGMIPDWVDATMWTDEAPSVKTVFEQFNIQPPSEDDPNAFDNFRMKLYSIPNSEAYRQLESDKRIPVLVSVVSMLKRMGVNETVIYSVICNPMAG